MMHVWTLNLTLSGPHDLIRAHFVDLVDRYAEIESADPRLLDCSWTLSHEPGAGIAEVQVDISVEAHDGSEAFVLAASAVRAAVHSAGGFTPDWTSVPPSGSLVSTALNSARELIET
jgi:hypothetical protein